MATIKDVARQAGVSVSTVSRVLTGNAKVAEYKMQAVIKAMDELGYRPNTFARALVQGRANSIGLVVGDLAEPFFGTLMDSVERVLTEAQQQIIIACGHQQADKERAAIEFLIDRNCDAIIIHAKALSDQALLELSRKGPPFVIINRYIPELADACVHLDNERGGMLATQYLVDCGHRRIGCITSSLPIEDSSQRLAGYQKTLQANGIDFDPALVVSADPYLHGNCRGTEDLLRAQPQITAIFAYNDVIAAGCIATLTARGIRVPEDISVIGFDDIHFARFLQPQLTTVRYPIDEMGKVAARMALRKVGLDGGKPVIGYQFEPSLVLRGSVGER